MGRFPISAHTFHGFRPNLPLQADGEGQDMIKRGAHIIAMFVSLSVGAAVAAPVKPHDDAASVTKGQVSVGGKTLRYTATAAQYPIYVNDTGEHMATMFFIAYVADRSPSDP